MITRIESKHYYVLPEDGREEMLCYLRGKFKNDFNLKKDKLYHKDIAVVGDYVDMNLNKDGTGFITGIDKRRNYLSRKAPKIKGASYRGERLEQIIAANIDNLFVISSIKSPSFNNRVIDRFITAAESSGIKVHLVINKSDLDAEGEIKEWKDLYTSIGYDVYVTSAKQGTGVPELIDVLKGKKNLFWGHSGVGKSSLLNAMLPDLNLDVGRISSYNSKGTHRTVTSIMIKADADTFIIDTPGVREMDPFGIKKEDLGHYYVEFGDYINECRFNTCTHHHEPGCAVIEAVEADKISVIRYDSYLKLLDTIEEDMIF